MDDVKKKPEGEKTMNAAKEQENRDHITEDYICSGNCRTCPFPGAKCVQDPALWNRIK